MRVYRVKKRSDRQMAPFGRGAASARLRLNVVGLAPPRLLILKRNLNGFSPDLGSKHPTDSSSVLSDKTPQLNDKSSLISRFWTLAGSWKRVTELLPVGCLLLKSRLKPFRLHFTIKSRAEASPTTFERKEAEARVRPNGAICLSLLFLTL